MHTYIAQADVVELADTYVSEAYALQLEGSTPSVGTSIQFKVIKLNIQRFRRNQLYNLINPEPDNEYYVGGIA